MRSTTLFPLALLAIATGCNPDEGVAPPLAPDVIAPTFAASADGQWAIADTGETGPGSTYAIFVPKAWNGTTIFYAHGFNDVTDPVALPVKEQTEAFRERLGALGYAVAYSSYSENGYALKDGMQRTHQLRGLFASVAGQPERSYLVGHSLGGGVALALAEKFGGQYDGVLPMCGVVGGTALQVEYIGHVRALFDFFYPGVLPGDAITMPEGLNLNRDILIPALMAMRANPTGAIMISQITQTRTPFTDAGEPITGILNALGFHARGINDLLDRTHGQNLFDNSATVYTGSPAVPAATLVSINDPVNGVDRFTATPAAENFLDKYFQPTGKLSIPVLTLHTTRDPAVPIAHETALASIVNAAGTSSLLRQRMINRFGHCTFTMNEMVTAVQDLDAWVRTGIAPAN